MSDGFQISDGALIAELLAKALKSLDQATGMIGQLQQRIAELEEAQHIAPGASPNPTAQEPPGLAAQRSKRKKGG